MHDLLHTYNQLSEVHRRQLLSYADLLLIQQKIGAPGSSLLDWKERISQVSTWNEEDVAEINEGTKNLNQWKIPEW